MTPKFKIGDKVICISIPVRWRQNGITGGGGWGEGREFVINSITNPRLPIYWAKNGDGVYEPWLKLKQIVWKKRMEGNTK